MPNSDDPKLDDFQNPDEELDLSMFLEDAEKVKDVENVIKDEPMDMDLSFEESPVKLDLPDESLLGENTATFADELDMFADLDDGLSAAEPVEEQMEMIDAPTLAATVMEVPVVEDKKAKKAREKAEKAQALAQAKADKVAKKAQAKAEKAQAKAQAKAGKAQPVVQATIDDPLLVAAMEDASVVEDKKAKKAREKAEKAQAKAQAKAGKPLKAKKEKKQKEPGDEHPHNTAALAFVGTLVLMLLVFGGVNAYAVMKHGIGGAMVFLAIFDLLAAGALVIPILLRRSKSTITASDISMGIAAISLILGCMFVLANLAYNLAPH